MVNKSGKYLARLVKEKEKEYQYLIWEMKERSASPTDIGVVA